MARMFYPLTMIILLVLIFGTSGIVAYGSSSYPPSFGGGFYQYTDGLVINGKAFNISGYSQNIPTQDFPIGVPSTMTLKIFANDGASTIRTVTITFMTPENHQGSYTQSTIQYNLPANTVTLQDPEQFIASVKGSVNYSGQIAYVTFTITPKSAMNISNMYVSAIDSKSSIGRSTIVNAIEFGSDHTYTQPSMQHKHCTSTHPCIPICGDHPCKPGETATTEYVNLPSSTITITAYDTSGFQISGVYVQVNQSSQIIHSGYTPLTFNGYQATKYIVTVEKYDEACDFNHWKDDGSNRVRTIVSNSTNIQYGAVYSGVCP